MDRVLGNPFLRPYTASSEGIEVILGKGFYSVYVEYFMYKAMQGYIGGESENRS